MSDTELIEAYLTVDGCMSSIIGLMRSRVPFEQWPEELQGVCGVSEELFGEKMSCDICKHGTCRECGACECGKMKWIKCSERMPQQEQRVLAWDGHKVYDCALCGDVWMESIDDWNINTNDPVTHWMPLPEPPK